MSHRPSNIHLVFMSTANMFSNIFPDTSHHFIHIEIRCGLSDLSVPSVPSAKLQILQLRLNLAGGWSLGGHLFRDDLMTDLPMSNSSAKSVYTHQYDAYYVCSYYY